MVVLVFVRWAVNLAANALSRSSVSGVLGIPRIRILGASS
jgi:hypothetical protein